MVGYHFGHKIPHFGRGPKGQKCQKSSILVFLGFGLRFLRVWGSKTVKKGVKMGVFGRGKPGAIARKHSLGQEIDSKLVPNGPTRLGGGGTPLKDENEE